MWPTAFTTLALNFNRPSFDVDSKRIDSSSFSFDLIFGIAGQRSPFCNRLHLQAHLEMN